VPVNGPGIANKATLLPFKISVRVLSQKRFHQGNDRKPKQEGVASAVSGLNQGREQLHKRADSDERDRNAPNLKTRGAQLNDELQTVPGLKLVGYALVPGPRPLQGNISREGGTCENKKIMHVDVLRKGCGERRRGSHHSTGEGYRVAWWLLLLTIICLILNTHAHHHRVAGKEPG